MKNNTEETQKKIMAIISDAVTLGKINAIHEKRIEIILSRHSANQLVTGSASLSPDEYEILKKTYKRLLSDKPTKFGAKHLL